jgi:hypothetical protein
VIVIRSLVTKNVRELRPELISVAGQPEVGPLLWTPDGGRLIVGGVGKQGRGLYAVDVSTGDTSLIVAGTLLAGGADRLNLVFGDRSLSPDGSAIYYRRGARTTARIIERNLASGNERTVCEGPDGDRSPDGLLVYCVDPQGIIETNLRTGATRIIRAPDGTTRIWISPNGQSILAVAENVAHVKPVNGQVPAMPLGQFGRFLAWSPDSKSVVLAVNGEVWWVPVDGRPRQKLDGLKPGDGLALHPDGRRIVQTYSTARGPDEIWVVRGVLSPR